MSYKASIHGITALKKVFRAATPEMQAQFNEATEATVWAVQRDAQQRVPVDTGTLRDHIAKRFSPKTGFGRVGIEKARVAIAGAGGKGARVMETTRYAHLVHDGTVHMTGTPFMTLAAAGQQAHYAARLRAAGKKAERNLSVSRFT